MIVDHNAERGNPADAPNWHRLWIGSAHAPDSPRTVTAARSDGEKAPRMTSTTSGCATSGSPQGQTLSRPASRGTPPGVPAKNQGAHRREGRISTLERGYGWNRTRIDSTKGAKIRIGHGVLAHSLVKISTLAA